jgi:hypothetical protein
MDSPDRSDPRIRAARDGASMHRSGCALRPRRVAGSRCCGLLSTIGRPRKPKRQPFPGPAGLAGEPLCKSVISRDRLAFFWAPMRRNLFCMALAGIPNFSAATDGSRRGLHDASIARELIRRRFTQPRPPHLGVHARALGIRGGFADWDLFVFVISDSSAGPEPRAHAPP